MRAARAYADINQKELAGRLGVSASDVRRWEDADATKARLPLRRRQRFLHDVAEACEVSRSWVAHINVDIAGLEARERLAKTYADLSHEMRTAVAEVRASESADAGSVEEDLSDADEDAADAEKDDDEPGHTKRQPN